MPDIIKPDWYSDNLQRNYPFVDSATMLDDNNNKIPDDVVVGMHIWVPQQAVDIDTPAWSNDYGAIAYVSALAVTPGLVSLVISLGKDYANDEIIAHMTIPRPVKPGQSYPITPLIDGLTGWVMFGSGANESDNEGHWSISDRNSTALLAECVYGYVDPTGYSYVRLANSEDRYTGITKIISSSSDLLIEKKKLTLPNIGEVDAIEFKLNTDGRGTGLYQDYIGPCAGVPESGDCSIPPVTNINGVYPDSSGQITIEFVEQSTKDTMTIYGTAGREHCNIYYNSMISDVCSYNSPLPTADWTVGYDTCDPGETPPPASTTWLSANRPNLEFIMDDDSTVTTVASTGTDTSYSIKYELTDSSRYRAGNPSTVLTTLLTPRFYGSDLCSVPGADDFINISTGAAVTITISVRHASTANTDYQTILHLGNPSDAGLHVYVYNSRVYAVLWTGGKFKSYVQGSITDTVATHIAVVFNNDATTPVLSLYLNGTLSDSVTVSFTGAFATTSVEMIIGELPGVSGNLIDDEFGGAGYVQSQVMTHNGKVAISNATRTDGIMGNLMVWDYELSASDISSLYSEVG